MVDLGAACALVADFYGGYAPFYYHIGASGVKIGQIPKPSIINTQVSKIP